MLLLEHNMLYAAMGPYHEAAQGRDAGGVHHGEGQHHHQPAHGGGPAGCARGLRPGLQHPLGPSAPDCTWV